MLNPNQKEYQNISLDTWLNAFIKLLMSKYRKGMPVNFNEREKDSFGRAFEIYTEDGAHYCKVFWIDFIIDSNSNFEVVAQEILRLIQENRIEFERIVKFCKIHRTDACQNIDWADIQIRNGKIMVPGYNSRLEVKTGNVFIPSSEMPIFIDEYEKMMIG